jgi:hypothetical protein
LAVWHFGALPPQPEFPNQIRSAHETLDLAEIVRTNGIPDPFVADPCPLPLKNQERVFRYNNLLQYAARLFRIAQYSKYAQRHYPEGTRLTQLDIAVRK